MMAQLGVEARFLSLEWLDEFLPIGRGRPGTGYYIWPARAARDCGDTTARSGAELNYFAGPGAAVAQMWLYTAKGESYRLLVGPTDATTAGTTRFTCFDVQTTETMGKGADGLIWIPYRFKEFDGKTVHRASPQNSPHGGHDPEM